MLAQYKSILPQTQSSHIPTLKTNSPLTEVGIHHTVGETLPADTNTFKHTVTSELVHDKMGVDDTRLLHLIGDDTTNEMGMSRMQGGHQLVELFLFVRENQVVQ